jgi:large subunit ribosomal protein L4
MNKQKNIKEQGMLASRISFKDLALESEERSASPVGFSVCIRALLQNWRQGTVGCKGRSDVARSNKKPWKQKGTGRARAGSARSPLWRGGGVIFGPQARTRVLHVTKKVRQRALGDLLQSFMNAEKVVCLNWMIEGNKPTTSAAYKVLRDENLHVKRLNVFTTIDDILTQASFANIPNVRLMCFDQSNVFDLANSDYWIFLEKDRDAFKEMVSRWI